jgi:hypothetical protein
LFFARIFLSHILSWPIKSCLNGKLTYVQHGGSMAKTLQIKR